MPPSATDDDILAELLLAWEESGRPEPASHAAERLSARHPQLAKELERRIILLCQMAWLDDPAPRAESAGDQDPVSQKDILHGRYRLLKPLSRGWFGSLYHATDLELGRDVAIKVPRTRDASSADSLLREARYASRLRHQSIVPVFDAVRDHDSVFLVYEFIRGMDLSQRIAKGPLPWREALVILRQLIEATAHAHAAGVLHRDIKPANILLDAAGNALLADFGSAVAIGQLPFSDSLGAGSVAFTAPEVLRGDDASRGSDFYAIGMVFHSMLHGRLPGADLTGPALRDLVLSPREWELSHSGPVPRRVTDLCRKMILKSSAARLSDPEAILNRISKALKPSRKTLAFSAFGALAAIVLGVWWWRMPAAPAIPPEAAFEIEHGPSPDGTIGGGILKLPVGLAFAPDGTILAANTARGQVCRFRWDGGLVQVLGRRGSGVRFLFYPHGVAVAPDGTVFVTDHGNHVVHAYAPDGNLVAFAGGYGKSDGRFIEPHGIAVGKNGKVYVGDNGNKRIQVFDQELKWLETIDLSEIGVSSIVGILVRPEGSLVISDRVSGKGWMVNDRGRLEGVLSAGPSFQPLWLAMDSDENIWVGDASKRIVVFGRDKLEKNLGDLGKRLSFYPQGLAFGPKGELGVVNYAAGKIIIAKNAVESLSQRR